jgi:hypothetical protein
MIDGKGQLPRRCLCRTLPLKVCVLPGDEEENLTPRSRSSFRVVLIGTSMMMESENCVVSGDTGGKGRVQHEGWQGNQIFMSERLALYRPARLPTLSAPV